MFRYVAFGALLVSVITTALWYASHALASVIAHVVGAR